MKRFVIICGMVILWGSSHIATADTFKHKESGEMFTGFVTQKVTGGKTLVYNNEEGKMTPIVMSEYDVTRDRKGRRETVSLVLLTQPEIMLSESVSKKAAAAITDASNKGPQAIIVQIDSPGGRGEYMKNIAQAISQTKNCPVYAYISGETFGGAFSSAALIALGCDKIYMNSTASIGAVGNAVEGLGDQGYGNFLYIFSPASLVTFSPVAATLAQDNGRPAILAKAMVDKSLSVAEISNLEKESEFVMMQDRQPTQTLIRTLSEGMKAEALNDLSKVTEVDVVGKVVNLTAQQALDSGMVDSIADSIEAILADQQMETMKLAPIPGIDNQVKKYTAARRNIADGLLRIEQQEDQVATLSDQFTEMDTQLRKGTNTREVAQGNPYALYRSSRSRYRNPDYYYNYYQRGTGISRSNSRRSSRFQNQGSERVMITEPSGNIQVVYQQLGFALEQLIAEYRRTVNLAKRWPGALPVEVSSASLQQYMDTAENELVKLRRYQLPYIEPVQVQQPVRTGRERIQNPNRY